MKKNYLLTYTAVALTILVPVAGRFGYGIVLLLALNLFMIIGTLFRKLMGKLHLESLQPVLIAVLLISCAIMYKQLLILYSPVLALVLGFSIYLTAISSFMIGSLYEKSTRPLKDDLVANLKESGQFSLYGLLFFLFRDIFGYGTLSLPVRSGLYTLNIKFTENLFSMGVLWASIPGALLLTAILLILFCHVSHQIEIAGTFVEDSEKGEKEHVK